MFISFRLVPRYMNWKPPGHCPLEVFGAHPSSYKPRGGGYGRKTVRLTDSGKASGSSQQLKNAAGERGHVNFLTMRAQVGRSHRKTKQKTNVALLLFLKVIFLLRVKTALKQ